MSLFRALISILFTLFFPSWVYAIDVQGHRGARAVLPENSLHAFEYALELGVDTLELDMGVTQDGVVVVIHDQTINPKLCQHADGSRVSKGQLVHQLTLAEIKSFDCGARKNKRFPKQVTRPGTKMPTLADVFQLVAESDHPNARSVQFNIETKSSPDRPQAQPTPIEFVRLVLTVIDQYDLRDRVILQSFDHRTLGAAKEMAPDLRLAALFAEPPEDWVSAAEAAQADIVSPNHNDIDAKDVASIQKAELQVIPWTVNNPSDWKRLIDMGVDGIITDDPEPLLQMLERR